ncbi:MAG: hypothetical protein EZS28_036246 [Streblomastix strix]|uniref:Amino acid transporter transmembrane domain-containing protein n=1 Tax=Streblomastix strix TaxID=222440 RepID=A0A5J4UCI5_9EUKA|nr:MAG: hypothetical protein EZS28_036246 [Streblomastix strix]
MKIYKQKRITFWVTSTIARLIVISIVSIPSVTPLRKHFPAMISLVGATCGAIVSFILPLSLHLKLFWKQMNIFQKILDWGILFIVVPVASIVTYSVIAGLVNHT